LDNLDTNLRAADALFEPWPDFDACIGNPPYLGAKRLKQEHSPAYVNRVRAAFPDVPGNADYCVYWFRKAHEVMKPGARAGLVGTNTIRQNYSRIGGLDYIVAHDGHIYEAVDSIPWSGEAAVHISIACWSKGGPPFAPARLWVNDGGTALDVPTINSSLSPRTDVSSAKALACNTEPKRVFQGQIPGHEAFVLEQNDAYAIINKDSSSQRVIFPFLIGRDLIAEPGSKPSRYVIDLNPLDIIEVQQFKLVYAHIRTHVLPVREAKAQQEAARNRQALAANPFANVNRHHEGFLRQWWKHAWGRPDMLARISNLKRYIACSEVTKRPIFEFVPYSIRPDHTLIVFTFDDDYSFGILQSSVHWQWFTAKGSTLTERFRYTPHSVFDTFPWPQQPTAAQVKAVAEAGRALHEYRRAAMAKNERLTLRDLYRSLETPGKNPLKELHAALDAAVLAAYGFAEPHPPAPSPRRGEGEQRSDVLAQLLDLNQRVAAKLAAGEAVTAPGIPADYPHPAELVSSGCITPPELA
jgi:hypothetical protein